VYPILLVQKTCYFRTLSWYKSFGTVQSCSDLGKILFCSKSKKSKNEFLEKNLRQRRLLRSDTLYSMGHWDPMPLPHPVPGKGPTL
jgi:hypothetical protein